MGDPLFGLAGKVALVVDGGYLNNHPMAMYRDVP
jgi:hypothetical protein